MRLSFGQEKQLKEYLLTELEPISDADPVVLADYVLALVKQDHSIGDLKIMCMDQLIDFLLPGKTKDFVDKLFYQLEGVQPMETEDPRRQERRERPDQRQERSDRQDRSDYRQERFDQRQERFDRPDHRERQDPRDRRQKRDRFSPYQRKQERRQEYVKSKPHQLADVLHVQNIPQENCTYEQIHDYFTQFGNIINLSVDPERRTCVIQYSSSEEADKCYNSPKVIFDNRFVKVFWATLEDAQQQEMEQRRLEMEQIETEQRAIAIKEKLKQAQLQKQAQAQQQIQTRQQLIDNQLQEQQKIMKQLEDPQLGEEEKKQLLHRMKLLSDSTMSMLASQPVQAPIGTVVGEEQVDPQLANELSELKQQVT
ncbi:hypothetical protein EDD86DRAFT_117787 [Gorgonomyces haynaldii]|nr:hypothetical protein EDD86DRAFT_117787 [Gorgonomyces haynaldii]